MIAPTPTVVNELSEVDAQIVRILRQCVTAPSYTPPVTMYQLGRRAYRAGKPESVCINDEMRRGWQAAWQAGAAAYWQAMSAEGLESQAVEVFA